METKVLFICRQRLTTYGMSVGLVNSATFVSNFLNDNGIKSKVVIVVDSNKIDKEVSDFKPTHVFLEAIWVPPYKMEELLRKWSDIQWSVRVHSKIPFLANEGIAIPWITAYDGLGLDNFYLSGNSLQFIDAIEESLDIPITYTPNMYYPDYKLPARNPQDDGTINIGCFGAIRPMKNHLMQAMAAITFGNNIEHKIKFHINGGRTEQNGEQVLKNLEALFETVDHELVNHPWKSHIEFLALVSTMDMGMQISLSETYNIVSADFISMGIPILVSPEIYWMPRFRTADPNDINDIASQLKRTWQNNNFITRWWTRRALKSDNKRAQRIWLHLLTV